MRRCVSWLPSSPATFITYWYSRGAGLFRLEFETESGESYADLVGGRLKLIEDDMPGLTGNYSAACFIPPDRVVALRKRMETHREPYFKTLEERGFESLVAALDYAASKGLGFIEAADVVVPSADAFLTRSDLMRAHYLKNMTPCRLPRALWPFPELLRTSVSGLSSLWRSSFWWPRWA